MVLGITVFGLLRRRQIKIGLLGKPRRPTGRTIANSLYATRSHTHCGIGITCLHIARRRTHQHRLPPPGKTLLQRLPIPIG